jgi:hypothetical protein
MKNNQKLTTSLNKFISRNIIEKKYIINLIDLINKHSNNNLLDARVFILDSSHVFFTWEKNNYNIALNLNVKSLTASFDAVNLISTDYYYEKLELKTVRAWFYFIKLLKKYIQKEQK